MAKKFRDAGLDTEIVEYKVWLNYPTEIHVDLTAPAGVEMHGPRREHVDDDPFQDDPRVINAYNGMSPSGDAEADVVYANYGIASRLRQAEADERRRARQDRHCPLRGKFSGSESICGAGARSSRRHYLLRSER